MNHHRLLAHDDAPALILGSELPVRRSAEPHLVALHGDVLGFAADVDGKPGAPEAILYLRDELPHAAYSSQAHLAQDENQGGLGKSQGWEGSLGSVGHFTPDLTVYGEVDREATSDRVGWIIKVSSGKGIHGWTL